jgi:hypothetical protein
MAKIQQPPEGINLESYADDTTVFGKGPKLEPICLEINLYLDVHGSSKRICTFHQPNPQLQSTAVQEPVLWASVNTSSF